MNRNGNTRETRRRRLVVTSSFAIWFSWTGAVAQRAPVTAPATGAVEGVVRLSGSSLPRPTRVDNTTDPAVCGRQQTLQDLVVMRRTRGIQDVIVVVDGVPPNRVPPLRPDHLVLDNTRCRFAPHVAAVTVGSIIEAANSDPVLHTTHLYGPIETNVALPLKGMRVSHTVSTTGTIIAKCDVHGWMQAFIRVDPHPFHTVTAASGSFRIDAVPAGDYMLETWHEKLGTLRRPVHIRAGETTQVTIEYAAPS
jgi:polysaccharide lyase family 4-like protein